MRCGADRRQSAPQARDGLQQPIRRGQYRLPRRAAFLPCVCRARRRAGTAGERQSRPARGYRRQWASCWLGCQPSGRRKNSWRPPPPVTCWQVSGSMPLLCSARTLCHQRSASGVLYSSRSMTNMLPEARPLSRPILVRRLFSPCGPYQRSNDASGTSSSCRDFQSASAGRFQFWCSCGRYDGTTCRPQRDTSQPSRLVRPNQVRKIQLAPRASMSCFLPLLDLRMTQHAHKAGAAVAAPEACGASRSRRPAPPASEPPGAAVRPAWIQ
jgi:hypothetical protein